ncbi:MAG: urease accessory protein UreF [Bacteroides sp.]|nr:urease accessory protein UreF [Bacteroides sp.]
MPDMSAVMKLLQFTDSTFPVGTFSFSNGLETASFEHIVHDAQTLGEFAEAQALQAAFSDGVAALASYRAALNGNLDGILAADKALMDFKMNDEARQMLSRMGKKLAELAVRLFPESLAGAWLDKIVAGETPGSYPVAQGIAFAAAGISERDLFCSHQYGVVNMVLGAALRCVRVSHYDTQEILFRMSDRISGLYEEVAEMELDDMHAFFPILDILASLHEKGNMRMFMN